MLIKFLESWSFDLEIAADGREAQNLIRQRKYDLIITDYQMPGMNGVELIREIKSRRPSSYVIGITGSRDQEVLYGAGAEFCIQKPFSFLDFERAMQRFLSLDKGDLPEPRESKLNH